MHNYLFVIPSSIKPAAFIALRFHFYMVIVFLPIGLAMYWPESMSFSTDNLLTLLKFLATHPLPWVNLGIMFCISLCTEIMRRIGNAV